MLAFFLKLPTLALSCGLTSLGINVNEFLHGKGFIVLCGYVRILRLVSGQFFSDKIRIRATMLFMMILCNLSKYCLEKLVNVNRHLSFTGTIFRQKFVTSCTQINSFP